MQRNVPSISDKDIIEIEKLENLESLSIVGQSKITDIDVSRLTQLTYLNISGNMKLECISGLDKLQSLEDLVLIANHELEEINGLNQCLNNEHIGDVSLDPQLFPYAINYNYMTKSEDTSLIEKMKNGDIDINFFEILNSFDDVKTNIHQMLGAHEKAKEITQFIDDMNPSRQERIMLTQAYIGDNVSYDHQSLDSGHSHSENGIIQGPLHGANSLYNCLCLNTCVCEGYTRGTKYLLGLQGIASRQVRCIAEKDNGSFASAEKNKYSLGIDLPDDGYHSILLVQDYKGQEHGYCDPCWNAEYYKQCRTMPFMLMGTEEIKQTHTLSLEEQSVNIMSNDYARKMIDEQTIGAIQKYESHKKDREMKRTRLSQLEEEQKKLQAELKRIQREMEKIEMKKSHTRR